MHAALRWNKLYAENNRNPIPSDVSICSDFDPREDGLANASICACDDDSHRHTLTVLSSTGRIPYARLALRRSSASVVLAAGAPRAGRDVASTATSPTL
jgi:hypothetical protein